MRDLLFDLDNYDNYAWPAN